MWTYHAFPRSLHIDGLYTAFSKKLNVDYAYRGETHPFAELVLVRSGQVSVTAGNDSFILNEGTAILHPPMEFHNLRSEGNTTPEIIIFSFRASQMPEFTTRVFMATAKHFEHALHILKLLEESTSKSNLMAGDILEGKEALAECAVLELEYLLLSLSVSGTTQAKHGHSAGLRNYRRALSVISKHLREPLNTDALAALVNVSPSLLKKLFSYYAGVGVMEYFREQKINAAIPLLREGHSVQSVAEHFGFSDPGYFATVFRRITGNTPTYFRTH